MMRRAVVLFAVLAASIALAVRADDPAPEPPFVPDEDALTACVLEVIKSYPTDGTHKYHWPKGSSWAGTTRDLVYRGAKVADGDPEKRCYCCGLTFEVLFRAWEKAAAKAKTTFRIGDLGAAQVTALRVDWFGSTKETSRKTLQVALEKRGLGRAIPIAEARPGDFLQLWRADKSGHSVVFLGLERDGGGAITGVRYWSTQKSTDGIGERVEKTSGKHAVLLDECYVGRAGKKKG